MIFRYRKTYKSLIYRWLLGTLETPIIAFDGYTGKVFKVCLSLTRLLYSFELTIASTLSMKLHSNVQRLRLTRHVKPVL